MCTRKTAESLCLVSTQLFITDHAQPAMAGLPWQASLLPRADLKAGRMCLHVCAFAWVYVCVCVCVCLQDVLVLWLLVIASHTQLPVVNHLFQPVTTHTHTDTSMLPQTADYTRAHMRTRLTCTESLRRSLSPLRCHNMNSSLTTVCPCVCVRACVCCVCRGPWHSLTSSWLRARSLSSTRPVGSHCHTLPGDDRTIPRQETQMTREDPACDTHAHIHTHECRVDAACGDTPLRLHGCS